MRTRTDAIEMHRILNRRTGSSSQSSRGRVMRPHPHALIAVSIAFAILSMPHGASAQQPAAFKYADGSPHPVTPWGDPDLQGMWPIMHLFATPLQRSPQYGDRRLLTDAEWKRAEGVLQARE